MTATKNGIDQLNSFKDLIEYIRSDDEQERVKTISQIPKLVLQSINGKNEMLDQLLLVIYNLNVIDDNFEALNLGNRTTVFRNLLRLYTETIQCHKEEQIDALIKLIDHLYGSSELLIELANALYHCDQSIDSQNSSKEDISKMSSMKCKIDEALQAIEERASENLYSDALLMIHSIIALRQQQKPQNDHQKT